MKVPTLIKREEHQQPQQQHQPSVVAPMDVVASMSTPPAEVIMPVKIPLLVLILSISF